MLWKAHCVCPGAKKKSWGTPDEQWDRLVIISSQESHFEEFTAIDKELAENPGESRCSIPRQASNTNSIV